MLITRINDFRADTVGKSLHVAIREKLKTRGRETNQSTNILAMMYFRNSILFPSEDMVNSGRL